jgi:hypothetical protein
VSVAFRKFSAGSAGLVVDLSKRRKCVSE